MATKPKQQWIDNIELGTGKFVNITFIMNAEQIAVAIKPIARLIAHNLMTKPYYGVNSIGFYWTERSNVKKAEKETKSYSQEVDEVLEEISQNYNCQIVIS